MTKAPARHDKVNHNVDKTRATNRMVASFEHIGKPMDRTEAQKMLESWASI
jgi:hypothetical protein